MWGWRYNRTSLGAKPKEGQIRGLPSFPWAVTVRLVVLELASISGTEDSPGSEPWMSSQTR